MKQETFFFGGDRAKPLVIFIHGMGMDANMWVEPVTARVMGGKYPLSVLIEGKELQSSFHDLRAKGYPVLTWSQRRPAGPVGVSVDELSEIIENYNSNSDAGIILVGHGGGGLSRDSSYKNTTLLLEELLLSERPITDRLWQNGRSSSRR